MIPSKGFAVSVLTNADAGRETRQTIADRAQRLFLGFDKPEPREAEGLSVDHGRIRRRVSRNARASARSPRDGKQLRVVGTPPPRFVVDPHLQPIPLPPAQRCRSPVPIAAAVLDGPRKGERVEFLRDAAGPNRMVALGRTHRPQAVRLMAFSLGPLARHRDFVHLWAAQSVSAFGSRITRTALPVIAILLVTADPVQIAVLGCARR